MTELPRHSGNCGCDVCFMVRKTEKYDRLFDPTPLSLDILRAELGEPNTVDKTMTRHFARWRVGGEMIAWNELTKKLASGPFGVTTLGELRRILSVVRERSEKEIGEKLLKEFQEAAKAGE